MHIHLTPSELFIGMLVVLAAVALLAEKLKIAYPILLVIAGLVMGVLPVLFPNIYGEGGSKVFAVNPEIVFLIFLPPLLYYAGLLTTWRDFKANIRPISELAVGLVLVTMIAVAYTAHYFIPELSLPMCFLLGAIVAPPDAVAATSVLEKLPVPKRIVTVLEGESLVNDATALVAYRVALGVIAGGTFSWGDTSWRVFVVAVGGIAVGLIAAWILAKMMEKIEAPLVESTVALLVPFAAYIPAEKLQVSGVLAAVAAGIYMGRRLPEIGSPRTRIRTLAVWDSLVFLLNGIIFILIGLQLNSIVIGGLEEIDFSDLLIGSLAVTGVAIVVRMIYVFPAAYLPRLIPALRKDDPAPPISHLLVLSWAGMRGIVTLAAAFALPVTTPESVALTGINSGISPSQRNAILFVSFVVILITLVFQGFTLAPLIKILKIRQDHSQEEREEAQARLDAAHAALSRLAVLSFDESINPDAISRVRAEYDNRILRLGGDPHDPARAADVSSDKQVQILRLEALVAERKMITFMRDQNIVGDEVLRRILVEIDLEEAKLTR